MEQDGQDTEISTDLLALLEQEQKASRKKAMVDAIIEEDPNAQAADVAKEVEGMDSNSSNDHT